MPSEKSVTYSLTPVAECFTTVIARLANGANQNLRVQTMTTEQITTKQIKALLKEAIAAGDQKQVRICERALDGRTPAIAECTRIIQAAKANAGR